MRDQLHLLRIAAIAAFVAGCGGRDPGADHERTAGLADTRWRLVEIQSMDDAIGTTRPDDPFAVTMHLRADSTVVMQLDCNRANGAWAAVAAADDSSGRFRFGPLAATRAVCPPPNLGERILAQAPYVRGFLLRDGRLNLSLMADGGILVWEPDTSARYVERERLPGEPAPAGVRCLAGAFSFADGAPLAPAR